MKYNGFDISVDELDNDMIAINFDKNGRAGGYISIKMADEGVVVDIFDIEGTVLGSTWCEWNELEPQGVNA